MILLLLSFVISIIIIFLYNINSTKFLIFGSQTAPIKIGFLGGVHGNEPAGYYALVRLAEQLKTKNLDCCVKIILLPNSSGIILNSRRGMLYDINRSFQKTKMGLLIQPKKIADFLSDCDIILDIHEAWSWNKIDNKSVGATLMPSNSAMEKISQEIIKELNKTIIDENKKYGLSPKKACDIPRTLSCFFKDKNYILMEIPGQNNIQPLEVRINHALIACKQLLTFKKIE